MRALRISLALIAIVGLTFGAAGVVAAGGDYYDGHDKKKKAEKKKPDKKKKAEKKKPKKKRVTICHRPPGNPKNGQTLRLPKKAAKKHLEKHKKDSWGPCKSYGHH